MSDLLFAATHIASLQLNNRLVRSATAERMSHPETGEPLDSQIDLYEALGRGGAGLIITGHMYVHPSGKATAEMTGIYSDQLIPSLARIPRVIHQHGGKVVAQINHGGMQCFGQSMPTALAPSAVKADFLEIPNREISEPEIEEIITSFAQAARRAKDAGFDGIQIHAAHGYLISQFFSPFSNHRKDRWGGSLENRMRFLREVSAAIRRQVGNEYPVLVKLGVMDGIDDGLVLEDGKMIAAAIAEMGIDAIEISGGIAGRTRLNSRPGIKPGVNEAYFLPLAKEIRPQTKLPLILVGGYRTRTTMESVLQSGLADLIALCRPFICEPDLPIKLKSGVTDRVRCISANRCYPEQPGEGIACKCFNK